MVLGGLALAGLCSVVAVFDPRIFIRSVSVEGFIVCFWGCLGMLCVFRIILGLRCVTSLGLLARVCGVPVGFGCPGGLI